jgi:hypothetical protein
MGWRATAATARNGVPHDAHLAGIAHASSEHGAAKASNAGHRQPAEYHFYQREPHFGFGFEQTIAPPCVLHSWAAGCAAPTKTELANNS